MTTYRVYRLSPFGKIQTGHWLEAANDQEVRLKALELCDVDNPSVEIWCGKTRLDTLANPPPARPS